MITVHNVRINKQEIVTVKFRQMRNCPMVVAKTKGRSPITILVGGKHDDRAFARAVKQNWH